MADSTLKDQFKKLKIKDQNDINILLLGEKGVGKSTFINAFANYLTYLDFEKAQKEKLLVLIPTEMILDGTAGKKHKIIIGSNDTAEYVYAGEKTFQNVRTFIFPIPKQKMNVRLIDTFGIDHREDDAKCEDILNYISNIHQLHAVCFLIKPPNNTFDFCFRYYLKQIFSRLDTTVTRNIAFIFTNINSADYSPKKSIDLLYQTIEEVKKNNSMEISIGRNVFCFDNEAFMYLAACKNSVKNMLLDETKAKQSWRDCVEQCYHLINYITGGDGSEPIKPQFLNNPNSINTPRKLIQYLYQPLADVIQLIGYNIDALQKHCNYLNSGTRQLNADLLFMPVLSLELVRLIHPVTVCTKCAEVIQVHDINQRNYTQVCHKTCYIADARDDTLNCVAMDATKTCSACSCDYTEHQHIYYMTKIKLTKNNVTTVGDFSHPDVSLEAIETLKKYIQKIVIEFEEEYNNIINACAKFSHFLQLNNLTKFTDKFRTYVECLLKREKSLKQTMRNIKAEKFLEDVLKKYDELVKNQDDSITSKSICKAIDDLYKLKHTGEQIKQMYECQKSPRKKEHENSEYKYVVKQNEPKKKNSYVKQTGESSKEKKTDVPKKAKNEKDKNNGPSNEKKSDKPKKPKDEKDKTSQKTNEPPKERKSDNSKKPKEVKQKVLQEKEKQLQEKEKMLREKEKKLQEIEKNLQKNNEPNNSEDKIKKKKEKDVDKRNNRELPPPYSELMHPGSSHSFDPSVAQPFSNNSTPQASSGPAPQTDGHGSSLSKIHINLNVQHPPENRNQNPYSPHNYPPASYNYPTGPHNYPPGPHNQQTPGPYNYPPASPHFPPGPQPNYSANMPNYPHNYLPGPYNYPPGPSGYPAGPRAYPPGPPAYPPGPQAYPPPLGYPPHYSPNRGEAFRNNHSNDSERSHKDKSRRNKNVKQTNINKAKSKLRNKKTEKKTQENSNSESESSSTD